MKHLIKQVKPNKTNLLQTVIVIILILSFSTFYVTTFSSSANGYLRFTRKPLVSFNLLKPQVTPTPTPIPTPTATPTLTPTPTPRPLTFAEMNALYGPCAYVPTLFYHHVQDINVAKQEGHASLTVDTEVFKKQMQYLKDHGYTTIKITDLINVFDAGGSVPAKSILLTFDDGYDDFGSVTASILRDFGFQAMAFIPTGLIENPGYMSWSTISNIAGWGNIYFANHTWSHHNVSTSRTEDESEIGTADKQLAQRGLNPAKVFAYPYGNSSPNGEAVLTNLGYKMAFTTYPGSVQCKAKRFVLPRIRIGNTSLSAYGF